MINPYAIWTIARCETRLLWRSWAFRLFSGLALVILFFLNLFIGTRIANASHFFHSLSGALPLANVKLLNLYQGTIAAFLATEFFKRDRQQDTGQTLFVHSYTNLDYTLGKILGVLALFLGLQLVVLTAVAVNHRFFAPALFAWKPYLLFTLFATLPTLVFTVGVSCLLISLLRSQALVLAIVLGLSLFSLLLLGQRFSYYFDIFAFFLPIAYSDFIGLGNLEQLLLVRSSHFLIGLGCVGLTALLIQRLRQSRQATAAALLLFLACAAGAAWSGATYLSRQQQDRQYRQELRAVSLAAASPLVPVVTACQLEVGPPGGELAVYARLTVLNPNQVPLDSLLFTLNPGLRVTDAAIDGRPARLDREEHLLRAIPDTALAPGSSCRLDLSYRGAIDPRFCYLDIDDERFTGRYSIWLYRLPKAYAFAGDKFLHLTPESGWYPVPGLPPGAAFPQATSRSYARYQLSAIVPRGWTAFSQGEASVDSSGQELIYHFQPEQPLPQVSLTAGPYELRQLAVDDVTYSLATLPGHDYFAAYFDSVAPVLPDAIRELKNDYEMALGLEYPYPRLSLVEVPIQFYAYRRLWTAAQETVQPEIVFLPEMGTLCEGADFSSLQRQSNRRQERANQAESAEQLQSDYLRTFVRIDLLGMQDRGLTDLSQDSSLEARWFLLPSYLSYATHISSEHWPVLNYAVEAYFQERVAPPANIWGRQWRGLTEAERANLVLQEHSLEELLALAGGAREIEPDVRETAVRAKGRHLLLLLAARIGPERFAPALDDFVAAHRHRVATDLELLSFLEETGTADPESLLDTWYRATDLAGYQVERTDVFLVRQGERIRTQVELDLVNPTQVDGLVGLHLRYRQDELTTWWERRGTRSDYARPVWLPARTRKQVGLLLDQPLAELIVDTYVARNIPILIFHAFPEQQKLRLNAEPFSGERIERLEDSPAGIVEYLVDNEDEGFELLAPSRSSWLRRTLFDLLDLREQEVPYAGLRHWNPPATWQATTDHRFYGRFVRSGYYKKPGDGQSRAAWHARLDQDGDYDIHFYCGLIEELRRGGRGVRGEQAMNFLVHHEDGIDDLHLDLSEIERGWNLLGTYRLAAGPARVELSDRSARRMVVADAVRWVKR